MDGAVGRVNHPLWLCRLRDDEDSGQQAHLDREVLHPMMGDQMLDFRMASAERSRMFLASTRMWWGGVVTIDAALHAFDAAWRGLRDAPRALMDAWLNMEGGGILPSAPCRSDWLEHEGKYSTGGWLYFVCRAMTGVRFP